MTALGIKVSVVTLVKDKRAIDYIDCDDWSKSHEYAMWLCENADNLGLDCPF